MLLLFLRHLKGVANEISGSGKCGDGRGFIVVIKLGVNVKGVAKVIKLMGVVVWLLK